MVIKDDFTEVIWENAGWGIKQPYFMRFSLWSDYLDRERCELINSHLWDPLSKCLLRICHMGTDWWKLEPSLEGRGWVVMKGDMKDWNEELALKGMREKGHWVTLRSWFGWLTGQLEVMLPREENVGRRATWGAVKGGQKEIIWSWCLSPLSCGPEDGERWIHNGVHLIQNYRAGNH